jgi:hypothetical protein
MGRELCCGCGLPLAARRALCRPPKSWATSCAVVVGHRSPHTLLPAAFVPGVGRSAAVASPGVAGSVAMASLCVGGSVVGVGVAPRPWAGVPMWLVVDGGRIEN